MTGGCSSLNESCSETEASSSCCVPAVPAVAVDDRSEDAKHTARVISAFLNYARTSREKVFQTAGCFRSLSKRHRDLLCDPHTQHIRSSLQYIDVNQLVFSEIVDYSSDMFGDKEAATNFMGDSEEEVSHDFMSKVQSTLRQIAREWSSYGKQERQNTYGPILEEMEKRFPNASERHRIQCLVPGAGLGRLAWDLVSLGFSVEANEYSMFMLMASCFLLNCPVETNSMTIYPFVHETSNLWKYEDSLVPVHFPDVSPSEFAETEKLNSFSMSAGNFLEVTRNSISRFDCVVTAWFIDTAHNVVEYIERILEILKPGGVWVNTGPLTYHFADVPGELSIELPYEEVLRIVKVTGFTISNEKRLESTYSANRNSMLRSVYDCAFFVAVKPEENAQQEEQSLVQ